ncbi:MAG: exodeoxyribonuclease VII small subunit [Clostridiales bacterium]|nr:exodeoxyribonuclease VII small subunit [Clostridiales bacterium]
MENNTKKNNDINKIDADSELTYEKAMSRVEQIVNLLEGNDISLDESIKLFDEGTKLTAVCAEKLKQAELKITTLKKNNED